MLSLSTFCMLLALAVAHNVYNYDQPGKSFNIETTPNHPGYPSGPANGFPISTSATSPSFPNSQQGHDNNSYQSTVSTPGFQSIPSSTNQGYQEPSYLGSKTGTPASPKGLPNQSGSNFPGANNNFLNQGPKYQGTGQNYPGQGQSYPDQRQNYPKQDKYYPGEEQNYSNQPGLDAGSAIRNDFSPSGPNGDFEDDSGLYEEGDYSAIPGEPDKDYPILTEIPQTSFRCDAQAYPGYYADIETRCQVFHVCANNITYDFLCPNGTIFSQKVLVCVWWHQFDCNSAPNFYSVNANIYDDPKGGPNPQIPGQNDYGQRSQGPSASYLGRTGPQAGFPEQNDFAQQTPLPSYPASAGQQTGFPGQNHFVQQNPPPSYPSTAPQAVFPGQNNFAQQNPSPSYPSTRPQAGFPGQNNFAQQNPSPSYPSTRPQAGFPEQNNFAQQNPSPSYPSTRPQAGFPEQNNFAQQNPSPSYPSTGPQAGFPRQNDYSSGPQGPTASYLESTVPQRSLPNYPGSNGYQSSPSTFTGNLGQKAPTSYPGNTGPQGPSAYADTTGPQGPSTTYPTNAGSQSFVPSYPGSTGSSNFPGSIPSQGPTVSYPSTQIASNFPSLRPESQGYQSGKPSGPPFPPSGKAGRSDSGFLSQQPTREYLPPRN